MGLIFTRVKSRDRVAGCDGMEAKVGGGDGDLGCGGTACNGRGAARKFMAWRPSRRC